MSDDDNRQQPPSRSAAPRVTRRWSSGQALTEFALVSVVFLTVVFGTIDFGRSIYMYAQLTNSVREGARYAKVHPTDASGAKSAAIAHSPGLGLVAANLTVSCSSSCTAGNQVTVSANLPFTALTQDLLRLRPFTMRASARVTIE